jgi:hypothetical protein
MSRKFGFIAVAASMLASLGLLMATMVASANYVPELPL